MTHTPSVDSVARAYLNYASLSCIAGCGPPVASRGGVSHLTLSPHVDERLSHPLGIACQAPENMRVKDDSYVCWKDSSGTLVASPLAVVWL